MKRLTCKIYYIILGVTVNCFITEAFAAPQVIAITQTSNQFTVSGSNFGAKSLAPPKYFNTMEAVPLGSMPTGFIVKNGVGTPVATSPERGGRTKAMRFHADAVATSTSNTEVWNRSVYDLGAGGSDKIFVSYWLYIDKTVTCTNSPLNTCQWQFKNTYIGSHPTAYTQNDGITTTMGIDDWYKNSSSSWFNVFKLNYYNGLTSGGGSNPSATADAYLFNQWQRIDVYVQRSTSPLTPDGQFMIQRIGKSPRVNDKNIITHAATNPPWQYIAMGQAITNVNSNYVGLNGRVQWTAYYGDVYIDTTQARIEICDTPTWAARTHCELQPATAWADGQVEANFNLGSFINGQTVYFYVVDSSGLVNSIGTKFTIGGASLAAPKNATGSVIK